MLKRWKNMQLPINRLVPGYPNYIVTREGEIYSNYKKSFYKKLTPRIKNNGYAIVSLRNTEGIKHTFNWHQVVAMAWIPNPYSKPYVCHKNNIRTDNRVSNLYWGTAKENTQQCIKDNRFYREEPKLKDKLIQILDDYYTGKYTKAELARIHKVSPMTIYHYIQRYGKNKGHKEPPSRG